mgnify:CR=1 FL=1
MKAISAYKLAEIIEADSSCFGDDLSAAVERVCIDSRSVQRGDVFFAICGENFDGHDYVHQALEAGADCAVCSRKIESVSGKPVLVVDETVKALGRLANFYRNEAGFNVVGITGSAGKTTTRQIAYHVLSKHFKCHQAIKSFNNNIGLPLTLLGAASDSDIVIAELGTNNRGEIAELTAIAEPDIALVNNIFPAHLDGLGSIEGVIAEKASIAEGVRPGGKFLINGDFAGLVRYCKNKGLDFTTFGTDEKCDIRAEKLISSGLSGSITIDGINAAIPLGGRGNLYNAIAAWAVCKELGLSAGQFAKAVGTLKAMSMRMETKRIGRLTVIDDCYNANPASMRNAVEFLMGLAGREKKRSVLFCGEMAELGEESKKLHAELGEVIGKSRVDMVFVTGRHAETVCRAIRETGSDTEVMAFSGTDELCENIIEYTRGDDIILVKGSRSGRLEKAVEKITEIFSPGDLG